MNAVLPFPTLDLPAVYAVVGEHRHDPTWLLLLGSDGHHYAYHLLDGSVMATEPDADWRVDATPVPRLDQIAS